VWADVRGKTVHGVYSVADGWVEVIAANGLTKTAPAVTPRPRRLRNACCASYTLRARRLIPVSAAAARTYGLERRELPGPDTGSPVAGGWSDVVHSWRRVPRRSVEAALRYATLAALVTALGCRGTDTTVPREIRFAVVVVNPLLMTGTRSTISGELRVSCEYDIIATTAGGRPGDVAVWDSAVVSWAFGGGQTDRTTWSRADVADFFGADQLRRGTSQRGRVNNSSSGPFTVTHRFHYTVAGGDRESAFATLNCQ
jgi:hypothetical protein